jgi:hypothetical protein
VSLHRIEQEVEDVATLLGAGGDHGPDPFAPPATFLAPGSLRDVPIDHHEPNRLFRKVVRRLDSWGGNEAEVRFPVFPEPFRQILGTIVFGYTGSGSREHALEALQLAESS